MDQSQILELFAPVRAKFIESLEERILSLEALRIKLSQTPNCDAYLEQVAHLVHRIAGVAGTVGLGEISTQAISLEDLISRERAAKEPKSEQDLQIELALETLLDAMEDLLA